jgi:hypothetical protein
MVLRAAGRVVEEGVEASLSVCKEKKPLKQVLLEIKIVVSLNITGCGISKVGKRRFDSG